MKAAIVTEEPLDSWTESVYLTMIKQGLEAYICSSPEEVDDYHFAWIKAAAGGRRADKPAYWQAAEELARRGVPLINSPQSHIQAFDKLVSNNLFYQAGLSPLPYWTVTAPVNQQFFPLVCKPRRGSGGKGVVLVESYSEAEKQQQDLDNDCLLQPWVKDALCWRVIISEQGAVRVYQKKPDSDQLVAAINQGSERIVESNPAAELEEMALQMLRAVGGGIMGADILEDSRGKLWPLEINASFAFDSTDKEISRAIVAAGVRLAQ